MSCRLLFVDLYVVDCFAVSFFKKGNYLVVDNSQIQRVVVDTTTHPTDDAFYLSTTFSCRQQLFLVCGDPKKLSILKLFTTANGQKLGKRFHLFTAKTRIDTYVSSLFVVYMYFLPYLSRISFLISSLPFTCRSTWSCRTKKLLSILSKNVAVYLCCCKVL